MTSSNSRHRERHAKTLEIAQEEVLTCIGMCIYERLRRVHMCLKEEENACQVLAAVAVHALCRSFDMSVEKKRGISNLELYYKEISRAEKAKEIRKEQKKLKKKKKKNEKKITDAGGLRCCSCDFDNIENDSGRCNCTMADENEYDTEEQELNNCCNGSKGKPAAETSTSKSKCCANSSDEMSIDVKDEVSIFSCHSCEIIGSGCAKSIDGGYVSEPSSHHDGPCSVLSSNNNSRTSSIASSPEGSEVACSDGLCNHDQHGGGNHSHRTTPEYVGRQHVNGLPLTLQQMLVRKLFSKVFFPLSFSDVSYFKIDFRMIHRQKMNGTVKMVYQMRFYLITNAVSKILRNYEKNYDKIYEKNLLSCALKHVWVKRFH